MAKAGSKTGGKTKKAEKLSLSGADKKIPKPKKISKSALIATLQDSSVAATITVTFTSGIGQITSSLFRNGLLINLQSISQSGNINFADVQSGDSISINGVCTGKATIVVSVPTVPKTPDHFSAGNINTGYDIE